MRNLCNCKLYSQDYFFHLTKFFSVSLPGANAFNAEEYCCLNVVFLRRHSLSTHENLVAVVARRWRPTASEVAQPRLVAMPRLLERSAAWPRPAVYCCSFSSSGPKNIPNLCISEIYRWAESVSDSSKFRCPLAASKLGLHRQVIEAFELLNNFKYIFFLV